MVNIRRALAWTVATGGALCLAFGGAQAQHPLVKQRLQAWDNAAPTPSAAEIEPVVRQLLEELYPLSPACADGEIVIENVRPATADRFIFRSVAMRQLKNGWFVETRLPSCDSEPVRFQIMQTGDGSMRAIRVNRGNSIAWDSLFVDTLPLAKLAAISALKRMGVDCSEDTQFTLGATRVEARGEDLAEDSFGIRYSGSWAEVWPLVGCDHRVDILIEFTADGDGGAYTNIPGDRVAVAVR
ncbi:hypothetical protein [Altererythrobacter sp. MTPC7]|uniref:hypothetical protein n=1 Tax=Altererythrobacter sp. MTPC7 TaxID=3056567 RepID=UPI0036F348BF